MSKQLEIRAVGFKETVAEDFAVRLRWSGHEVAVKLVAEAKEIGGFLIRVETTDYWAAYDAGCDWWAGLRAGGEQS